VPEASGTLDWTVGSKMVRGGVREASGMKHLGIADEIF
jgi:hypothetical protein